MDELAKQAEVFFYGPGFPLYNPDDDIYEVIAKSGMKPDFIVFGHSWLIDRVGDPVDPHPKLVSAQSQCNIYHRFPSGKSIPKYIVSFIKSPLPERNIAQSVVDLT